jgi:molybdopterin converting factor small subunit
MPAVKIVVPANWRTVAEGQLGGLECDAEQVGQVLDWLTTTYPQFDQRIWARPGRVASWVNVYVGDDNIKDLEGLDTPITRPERLTVVPAFAGGSR